MAAARDRLAEAGCSVLAVAQAKPETLVRYLAQSKWTVQFASDPDRAAYAAFGLERTGWLTFFRPRVLWGYLRAMWRGYRVKTPFAGEDVLQLGGDFVLTRERKVIFAHASSDPTDRPAISDLLEAIQSARPIPGERPPDAPGVDAAAPGS